MDNFEYSIQISDRDWEEFYSTAEECGLTQVTLASEEELFLSDTEPEDAARSTASGKPKFIRVSLCPTVGDHREPKTTELALSSPTHTASRWIGMQDEVLSGSEDEEELGSVTRFLCQKDTLLAKILEINHVTDTLNSKPKENELASLTLEKSQDSPVSESLVGFMGTLNCSKNNDYKKETEHLTDRITTSVTSNEDMERGPTINSHTISITSNDLSKASAQLLDANDASDIAKNDQSCILLNGNLPDINKKITDPKGGDLYCVNNLQRPLGKCDQYEQLVVEKEIVNSININSNLHKKEDPNPANSLLHDNVGNNTQDWNRRNTVKANENSSAVQQNVQSPLLDIWDLSSARSDIAEPAASVTVESHDFSFTQSRQPRAEGATPKCSPFPFTIRGHSQLSIHPPTQEQAATHRGTAMTLPEMYDYFFDDVPEYVNVKTETFTYSNRSPPVQSQSAPDRNTALTQSEMYDFFFDGFSEYSTVDTGTPTCPDRSPLMQCPSASHTNPALTLPEMYDFFFDDVSEPGLIKSEAHMAGAEGIVYTPDMYDYFFVDDDDNTTKKKDRASEEPSTNVELAPAPSVEASWPEACEFFFADGPQDQNRGGILLSIPSSQAQRVSRIFQSIVPDGLKEFTVKGGCLDRDGKPIRYHSHGISEETNIATTGSLAPYMSPSRTDACLVFLALTSWAVKSSDMQSSDGWKTVLLANIGAISAIRYLRRRRKRRESSLQPLPET